MKSNTLTDASEVVWVQRIVRVESSRLAEFQARLQRMSSRFKALGLGAIEEIARKRSLWKLGLFDPVTGLRVAAYLSPYRSGELSTHGIVAIYEITLRYPELTLGDWLVIGRLTAAGSTTIALGTARDPQSLEALGAYAGRPIECGHCAKNRKRVQGFVLRSRQGHVMSVGTECILELTGEDPAGLRNFMSIHDHSDLSDEGLGWSHGYSGFATKDVVATACMVIKEFGFISSKAARERLLVSSAMTVMDILRDYGGEHKITRDFLDRRDHWNMLAEELISQARSQTRCEASEAETGALTGEDEPGDSTQRSSGQDFMQSVRLLLAQECIEVYRPPILAVAVAGVASMLRLHSAGPQPAIPGEWLGVVGKPMQTDCWISYTNAIKGSKLKALIVLVDAAGSSIKTFACLPEEFAEQASSRPVRVRMRVRAHEYWRGVKQTSVTHLKWLGWASHETTARSA